MTYKAPKSTSTEPGLITLAGDFGGIATSPTVVSITGASGAINIAATGNVITWASSTTSPGISQTAPISDQATANLTISSQVAFGSATLTNRNPGNIILNIPSPTNGLTTSTGKVSFQAFGAEFLKVLQNTASSSAQIISGTAVQILSNSSYINLIGTDMYFDATTTHIRDASNVEWITVTPAASSSISFMAGVTAASIKQADKTTNGGTGTALTIQAQNETGTTSTGGALNLTSGTGTTAAGALNLQIGGTTVSQLTATDLALSTTITLKTNVFNDATAAPVQTTTNALTTIYTDTAIPASTVFDFVVTVVGINTANQDVYRTDLSFTYARVGSGAPAVIGAAAAPLNVRTSGAANAWGGVSVAVGGSNNVLIQVVGAAATIDWQCSFSRVKVA